MVITNQLEATDENSKLLTLALVNKIKEEMPKVVTAEELVADTPSSFVVWKKKIR